MTWNNLPATGATDWSKRDFVNQFVLALNERRSGASQLIDLSLGIPGGMDPLDEVVVGDDVQAVAFIAGLQERAAALASITVDPDTLDWTPGVGSPPASFAADDNFWQTKSSLVSTYLLSNFLIDAGIAAGDWTRKYPREINSTGDAGSDGQVARLTTSGDLYEHDGASWSLAADQQQQPDLVVDTGECEAGDYIGPWIWNELQLAIQQMVHFAVMLTTDSVPLGQGSVAFVSPSATRSVELKLGQTDVPSGLGSVAAAQAEAEADWPDGGNNSSLDYDDVVVVAGATDGIVTAGAYTAHRGDINTAFSRRQIDTYSFPATGGLTRYLDVYAEVLISNAASTQPSAYDDKASGYTLGHWNLIRSGALANGATITVGDDPDTDQPDWSSPLTRGGYVLRAWGVMYFDWVYA